MVGNDFGRWIREIREKRGISLGSVARALGVTSPYMSNIELGKRPVFPIWGRTYDILAELLEVPATDLIGEAMKNRASVSFTFAGNSEEECKLALLIARKNIEGFSLEEVRKILAVLKDGEC